MSIVFFNEFINKLELNADFTAVKGRGNRWVRLDDFHTDKLLSPEQEVKILRSGRIRPEQFRQIGYALKARAARETEKLNKRREAAYELFRQGILVRDLYKSPDSRNAMIFLDRETMEPMEGDAEQRLLPLRLVNKDLVTAEIVKAPLAKRIFDIHKPFGFSSPDKYGVVEVNSYRSLDLSKIEDVQLNPLLSAFMNHLFPIEWHKQWMCSWMIEAATATCETLALLVGDMGTGKSTLMHFAASFHRHEMVEVTRSSGLTSRFNSNLEGKRLNCIDEAVCNTSEAKTAFKSLFNPTISIEAKGQDARKGRICLSHIATTNSTTDFHVEARDRRPSVPDLNQNPLPHHIAEFIVPLGKRIIDNSCTDKDWGQIKAFHKYCAENQLPNFKSHEPIKGEMFREMCENNMGPIPYMVFATLREAPGISVPYATLKKAWDDRPLSGKKTNFLSFLRLVSRLNFYLRENETLEFDKVKKSLTLTIKDLDDSR